MKNLFKQISILALLGLSLFVDKVSAASFSHPLTAVWVSSSSAGIAGTNIYSGPISLTSISIQNTNVAAQRIQFYDSATASAMLIVNMVSYTSFSSNKVTSFTTFGGTTQNNTNTVWHTTRNAAADVQQWRPSPLNLVVPGGAATAASVITYNFDPPIQMYAGVTLTNTAIGLTVTLTGDPGP